MDRAHLQNCRYECARVIPLGMPPVQKALNSLAQETLAMRMGSMISLGVEAGASTSASRGFVRAWSSASISLAPAQGGNSSLLKSTIHLRCLGKELAVVGAIWIGHALQSRSQSARVTIPESSNHSHPSQQAQPSTTT